MNREVSESAGAVETGVVQTNGVETYYERQGSGPAIVFVHGFIMDTRMWAPQVEVLADDFTIVTYDLRGHGRTGGSETSPYSAALLAADLDALVDALGLSRPIVCGLSMGGMVAQKYAATYPEKLSGLVLSDTFTPGALPVGGGLAMPHLPVFSALSHVIGYKRLNSFQNWVGGVFAPGMVGDRAFHETLVKEGPTMAAAEFRKGIGAILAFTRGGFDAAAINVPTLVMYGEHEPSPIRAMPNTSPDRSRTPTSNSSLSRTRATGRAGITPRSSTTRCADSPSVPGQVSQQRFRIPVLTDLLNRILALTERE